MGKMGMICDNGGGDVLFLGLGCRNMAVCVFQSILDNSLCSISGLQALLSAS